MGATPLPIDTARKLERISLRKDTGEISPFFLLDLYSTLQEGIEFGNHIWHMGTSHDQVFVQRFKEGIHRVTTRSGESKGAAHTLRGIFALGVKKKISECEGILPPPVRERMFSIAVYGQQELAHGLLLLPPMIKDTLLSDEKLKEVAEGWAKDFAGANAIARVAYAFLKQNVRVQFPSLRDATFYQGDLLAEAEDNLLYLQIVGRRKSQETRIFDLDRYPEKIWDAEIYSALLKFRESARRSQTKGTRIFIEVGLGASRPTELACPNVQRAVGQLLDNICKQEL